MADASVELAHPDRRQAAIDILVLALSGDPIARWKYSDPHDFLRYEPLFYHAFGGRAFDCETAYVVNKNAGAALWLAPNEHPDDEALEDLAQRSLSGTKIAELGRLFAELEGYHPKEPHWYLPIVGVDPIHQGKGYGACIGSV